MSSGGTLSKVCPCPPLKMTVGWMDLINPSIWAYIWMVHVVTFSVELQLEPNGFQNILNSYFGVYHVRYKTWQTKRSQIRQKVGGHVNDRFLDNNFTLPQHTFVFIRRSNGLYRTESTFLASSNGLYPTDSTSLTSSRITTSVH